MKSNKWFPLLDSSRFTFEKKIVRRRKWDAIAILKQEWERCHRIFLGCAKGETQAMEKYTKMLIIDIAEMFTFNKRLNKEKWRIKRKPYYKQNH